jgi:hypothetical protein
VQVLRKTFNVDSVKKDILDDAFNASVGQGCIDIDLFLSWYLQNMFTEVATGRVRLWLWSEETRPPRLQAKEYAAKHNIPVALVERVRTLYEEHDTDGSGYLGFPQFSAMIMGALRSAEWPCAPNGSLCEGIFRDGMSRGRMMKLWSEIYNSVNGEIDLFDFMDWYIEHFANNSLSLA